MQCSMTMDYEHRASAAEEDSRDEDTVQSHRSESSKFIDAHRADILAGWETAFRTMPIARELDRAALMDHVPDVLEEIANVTDEISLGGTPRADGTAAMHAIDRLIEGFDVAQVVIELGILRDCIMRVWEDRMVGPEDFLHLRVLNQAIDHTAAAVVEHYTTARDRTLQVLDRIANAVLGSRGLDALLNRLLDILSESTTAVDVAAILVHEGDLLRMRASRGFDEATVEHRQRIGEGFAGTIAAEAKPRELRSAWKDPIVQIRAIRESRVRALYGVPLVEGGQVVAVAYMGSRTTEEFSREDKFLFGMIAERAASAIFQHILREAAERTARVLRERELEFRGLADNISQLAWIADERGEPYWYNRRWLEFTGVSLDRMEAAGPEQFVHADHLRRVLDGYSQAVAQGVPWEDTFPMRGKDGRCRWFLTRAIPIRDSGRVVRWFGTNTDVTDQRFLDEATKVLNASLDYNHTLEQLARLAVPALADWCIVDLVEQGSLRRVVTWHVDPDKLELAREIARKYPPNLDQPQGVAEVIRTGATVFAAEIVDAALIRYAEGDQEHLDAIRAFHLRSLIIAPLSARGRTLGTITLMFTADSDRRYSPADINLANELGRRAGIAVDNARLYELSQQAVRDREQALRWREEVLAIVSHDLRGPLATIELVASNVMEELASVPHVRKQLEGIQRSGGRMDRMINDLLDVATIQAKGLTLNKTIEEPERILASIVETYEPIAAQKGMTLEYQSELGPVKLLCDRDRIEQVFSNLLGNALKYCRPADTITLCARLVDGAVELSVADTGPGIPPDELPYLFDPYWAAKRPAVKKGTGLGLYICKAIVEAHGGKLWVDSAMGSGTTFRFALPLPSETGARSTTYTSA
ncbi:MAG: hypothetical protein JWO36_7172 [Myxococcales bacterium]|nr:hypothetical protein [Myxococcales bacterium]